MSPNISDHDMSYRITWARKWLKNNDKVKISLPIKGRQKLHEGISYFTFTRFIKQLYDIAEHETQPKMNGNILNCILRPR